MAVLRRADAARRRAVRGPETPRERLAVELGRFLRTLHGAELMEAIGAGLPENWTRRADMEVRVPYVLDKLVELDELWHAPPHVRPLIESARSLPPPEPKAVCHGDLHFRHVLVENGRMSGVIDWIDLCRGEPALDLQLVWSVLPPEARERSSPHTATSTTRRCYVHASSRSISAPRCSSTATRRASPWLEREARASLDRAALGR